MIYGYVRVSTKEKNEDRQMSAMRAFGADRIFLDKQSGKDFNRPQYQKLLRKLKPDDMPWKNLGLVKAKNYDAERFTTDFGIKFRRLIHPLVHLISCIAVDRPVKIVKYPKLEKGKV